MAVNVKQLKATQGYDMSVHCEEIRYFLIYYKDRILASTSD